MKLYVCYGFLKNVTTTGRPGGHPCGNALKALEAAGHDPEVQAVHGLGVPLLDRTSGRQEVKRLTGQTVVPVLVTDDGEKVFDSKRIVAWAKANPAA
ncbi:MAG TPA: glutathione S-transferase N-terminal domain-containing protein [Thermoleophilaceae bacterium]|nr:glutathione S-transferase N-terminal domain-containing protein [Thermoleophilaceae bacterium]